uniref:DEP domain-containing protein n=1 Tax=Nomascus leucogenys TaxID=61853 RepID=A0A2I3GUU7_NOMLE
MAILHGFCYLRNEITTSFRAGMPLRKHRQHFKKYGSCFTAGEAVDCNFGPKVTRQHTIQLLRKFLKNHVIEDIKGRWGSENVDDNNQLFRFPATSPFKTLTPKKHGLHLSQENSEKIKHEIINEDQENAVDNRELSQEDVEEIWRYVILIYLQTILGVPSLEEVINPEQVIPQYIMYNMASTSKHGVVILQNKSDDLPHWVLSAMKCLANWPRSDVVNNPTYVGFEQGIFSTITDYFLDLLEPLLTFEYYELFVNILVVCGYVTVSDRSSGIHRIQDDPYAFFSVCFIEKEESDSTERLRVSNPGFQERCAKKMQRVTANGIMGGSWLSGMHDLSSNSKPRCCSLEGIVDVSGNSSKEASNVFHQSFPNIEGQNTKLFLETNIQKPFRAGFKRTTTLTAQVQEELCNGKCKSKHLLLRSSTRRNSCINTPVAEMIMKPNVGQGSTSVQTAMESELGESSATIKFSENSLLPASSMLTGTQSLLQPHLERVAIDVLQLCRLLLPPPNCRKLQLLMRMISQISQNVDMPKLHDAMGVRSLMIHTFSQCVLCCAEEVDLDKLLAGRLVSFLMDHHQEILQVLTYLQTAGHTENPGDGLFVPLPTYSYCKQISAQGFEKHKVYTSQAAITELLENVIKNKLTSKEKRKKLKQFQKEYPLIYQKRFPTTESEAALFGDKPTIKQPMLILRKPKFCSLRY